MENVKKGIKSRVVVAMTGILVISGLSGAVLSNNSAKADTAPTYEYVTHFHAKSIVVDPIASSEITPYPQNIRSSDVYTYANTKSPYLRITDQQHEIYTMFTSLNTQQKGMYTVKNGTLVNNKTKQTIKLQAVDITEITKFAHPNAQSVAPINVMLLTKSDYNYLSSQNGLQIAVNTSIGGFSND